MHADYEYSKRQMSRATAKTQNDKGEKWWDLSMRNFRITYVVGAK